MGTLVDIIDRSQKLRPTSQAAYRRACASYERAVPDPRNWSPLTVEAWRDTLAKTRKPQTVNRYLNGVRYAARRFEALGHGPDFARSAERLRELEKAKRHAMTHEDADAMLATCLGPDGDGLGRSAADVRDVAIMVVGLRTGLRATALCALEWSKIVGAKASVEEKGGKRHSVILDRECLAALEDWAQLGGRRGRVFRRIRTERITDTTSLGGPLFRQELWKIVRDRGKRAGVRRRLHPHLFRHTFISWALDSGVPPHRVMAQSGHKSMATFSGYVDDLQAEADPIGNHLPPLLKRPR